MSRQKVAYEELPQEWQLIGGRGLIAKIMNKEVPADTDPLGSQSKLIIAGGALAGTIAPSLGRISVGGKSPLTSGIKEASTGGPQAQQLDKLGTRGIIVEGMPEKDKLYLLKITKDEAVLLPADEYRGMNNYQLVEVLRKKFGKESSIISIGVAGERGYKSATVAFTDTLGEPSRQAGRGGLGAVMGAKGLKAIVIDDSGAPPLQFADKALFQKTVKSWTDIVKQDTGCGLFSTFGTPLAVDTMSLRGTMPAENYTSGRPKDYRKVSGETIRKIVWQRGGKMHGCMPGCVVQCSIIYNDAEGKRLTSAYEYEVIGLLGTNLGIVDPDAIGRMKYVCDDIGIDAIEVGSSMGVAASAGKMKMGDAETAMKLLSEVAQGTEFGHVLGNGVVATAEALKVSRVPAFKGQAIPAHDPRAVKGVGVTYATSPMGADHTAALTYRNPLRKEGQAANSLRFQVQAAAWDTFGYCLNAVPGGQHSTYQFLATLLNARYGLNLTDADVVEVAKKTLKDELKFNEKAEINKIHARYPDFVRTEALPPTNNVFDVEDAELDRVWEKLDAFKEPRKIWEVRFPSPPPILFGAGVIDRLGARAKALNIKKAFVIAGPVMKRIGLADRVQRLLGKSDIASVLFSEVEPDPPVEEVEKAGKIYQKEGCDGIVAIGGGSSLDASKAIAVRVTHPGLMIEYGAMVGGSGKIEPPIPALICIPTTSGTGSEVNQYAILTDKERDVKFVVLSDLLIPKLAIVDPALCQSMPPALTAETGVDALAHCIEGYVAMAIPYHPYYEALALYGTKLIGRSLKKAYDDGNDMDARTDMCMAAINGGIAFSKGLGLGHALGHVLGAHYHIPHGKALVVSLLCFVRANNEACKERFQDLARVLDGSEDLGAALAGLFRGLNVPARLRDLDIPQEDLEKIAFETTSDVANMTGNPIPLSMNQILKTLKEFY